MIVLGSNNRDLHGFLTGGGGTLLSLVVEVSVPIQLNLTPGGKKGLFWLSRSGALGNSTILVLLELVSAPELERPKVFYVSFLMPRDSIVCSSE